MSDNTATCTYTIRSFGDDRVCEGLQELHSTIQTHYRNTSVSIQFRGRTTGLIKTVFVDVNDGQLFRSDGDGAPLRESELEP